MYRHLITHLPYKVFNYQCSVLYYYTYILLISGKTCIVSVEHNVNTCDNIFVLYSTSFYVLIVIYLYTTSVTGHFLVFSRMG